MTIAQSSQLFTAGFYLMRWLQRPDGLGDDLLPARMLTLSTCLTDTFPGPWALAWSSESDAERIAAATKCGIPENKVQDIVTAMTAAFEDGHLAWPDVWTSLSAAQQAARRFGLSTDAFALVEVTVPRDIADRLTAELEPGPSQGASGVFTCLQRREAASGAGIIAGWELLGVETGGSFHSWLCNDLHHEAQRRLSIRPGKLGLLLSEEQARVVDNLIAAGVGAEPVPWFPAQLRTHFW